LPGQARFAENRLRILVLNLRQQLIDQFIGKQLRRLRVLDLLRSCCEIRFWGLLTFVAWC